MELVRFNFPTRIVFGPGARKQLVGVLREQGKTRPLFVTDRALAGLEFFQALVADVNCAGMDTTVFSEVGGNPVVSQVMAGAALCKAHKADSLIAIGGGAALDVGKAVALMAEHPGELFDYEDDKPDGRPVDQPIPFIVAMPTTSGTGSEVGRSSVISDDTTHVKRIIFSPRLLAPVVLADPELTLGLSPAVTAATGVDALSHCVEAFLSKGFHPMCDGIALEGIRLVSESLLTCYKEPGNLEARCKMMAASSMGAVAFQKGLGVVHSCAHALSAVCDMHHGLANAIMLPACMRFNTEAVPERLARMAQIIGAGSEANDFMVWLEDLLKKLDIPAGLAAAGVRPEHSARLVEVACKDVCHSCNPRSVSKADFEALLGV